MVTDNLKLGRGVGTGKSTIDKLSRADEVLNEGVRLESGDVDSLWGFPVRCVRELTASSANTESFPLSHEPRTVLFAWLVTE